MEKVLSNARIVLEDDILHGSVQIRNGLITDVSEGVSTAGEDLEGDYLLPGLVELHTDHLETHFSPRAGLKWNAIAAIQAHDTQVAGSGITTVLDCLRMGSGEEGGFARGEMRELANSIERAGREGRLRAEHLLHLRCEVSTPDVVEQFSDFESDPAVRMVSLMDHAPGQRQFQTMDQYIFYYKIKRGLSDEAFEAFVQRRLEASERFAAPHRDALAAHCAEAGIALASHDDATLDHVEESIGHGVQLAEFPTSIAAAEASHKAGLAVLMGAPNVVRGQSHSGNIAASDLARLGVLDVLSSDYVPFSLLHAPFILSDEIETVSLAKAIAMVSATPARTIGLDDRGRIATGLRADLVRVHRESGVPVCRAVWRQGKRVA
ncbi:alpha-D-ribose 1-methylphosphonate 5-triphosphate diphosphatase [Rhizobiales bacterium RZME27]|uniref:Alpha-D-ribose 1-methylphosphonate 5-triphosphate diphosphatase n=1 Tax=Endobacterium cereale TaxID=2663029 RepID=A0A6A8A522_9HYPH|nr:alpha-D-ribose 1-methylphosphonate 5-triphosphate diphosphatase [Endobacterium cereale]MEB2845006.1 alpha-D-ribose 1-methylphosphonate 5-triphosphate diphosphatase [Endobacterium cereale]MQY44918.1 alpha-D-ribose 1-methylphosphonate 5-triphosphate diphosphatase [Endobacterium cereale]